MIVPGWTTTNAPSRTSAPTSAPSPMTGAPGPSGPADMRLRATGRRQRALQRLQHANHAQAALAAGPGRRPVAHAGDEVLALGAQRLGVGDPRAPGVARPRDVLAVGAGALVEALVVHRHLALELHVVERGHPPGADDGEAPLLVWVQPGQVEVRGEAGREAQEAEDHVLDPGLHVGLAARLDLVRLLAGERQQHGHVVRAQAPQRVLLLAQHAAAEPARVDVADL